MATVRSFFNGFLSLFLLLSLHLGCCCCFSPTPDPDTDQQQSPPKRRKISPLSPSPPSSASAPKSLSLSVRSYLGRLFSSSSSSRKPKEDRSRHPPISPPSPTIAKPIPLSPYMSLDKAPSVSKPEMSAAVHSSFASREDVFPCPECGEVLSKPHLPDLHQTTHHSLSELSDADSGYSIVRIIFLSGWSGKSSPTIHRIFKIHNAPRTLARFEEYRDTVRSRASRRGGDERCIVDGNERLRFYCSTILCSLGRDGVCGSPYCSACGIVRHGFAGKQAELDGIATHATSWAAHASLPEDLEREFAYLHVQRAMLVCRVVAGRVGRGCGAEAAEEEEEEKGTSLFDSVVPAERRDGDEELLVFNPRALLPCFVVIYAA